MNRFIYALLFAFLPILALGQSREHIIKRGENVATISALYGIDERTLLDANPRLNDFCVVGMKLNIPVQTTSNDNWEPQDKDKITNLWEQGDFAFNSKNYKAAAKFYQEALDINRNDPILHYNLGLCYFNREKYKNAIEEFESCLSHSHNDELSKKAEGFQSIARERLAEERAKKREFWGAVGLAAAGTALAVGSAVLASQNTPPSYQSMPSYSTSGRISNSTLDQIDAYTNQEIMRSRQQYYQYSSMNYAIRSQMINNQMRENTRKFEQNSRVLEVATSFWGEWLKNPSQDHTILFANLFHDKYGRSPSPEEFQYFEEVYIKGLASMSGESSDLDSDTEAVRGSRSYSRTSISSDSRIVCSLCKGTGKIVKDFSPPTFGLDDYKKKCNECGEYYYASTGHSHITCPNCHGHKYID